MNTFKREYYLSKIRPFIDKQLIKVLTGQRRVGKSFLLAQIKDEILSRNPNANIIFINLEKLDFSYIQTFHDLANYIKSQSKEGSNYLFIDEIQEVEGFEKVLRSLLTEQNYDIYCTGSNAKMLSGELATLLSGRQIEFRIHTLSYPEFLEFHQKQDSKKTLFEYLQFGGMPYLINLPEDDAIKTEYLKNIFNTILFRDVIARYDIRDIAFLENLIRYVADNIGSLLSATNISKYLKSQNYTKTTKSVINYLAYIENSFCINKLRRIDIHGKKIFEFGEKYYFEDVGIRNTIVGYNIGEINKLIENVIHNHLLFHNYKVFIGKIGDLEIDFVAEKEGEFLYIQATYLLESESTLKREFGNLLKIQDNYPKYVISLDSFSSPNTYKGITHLKLADFLLDFS